MSVTWCALCAITVCFASDEVIRIPLQKHQAAVEQPKPVQRHITRVIRERFFTRNYEDTNPYYPWNHDHNWRHAKYMGPPSIYSDVYYYGPIAIGTPPQVFHVAYDTAPGVLLVPSSQCGPLNIPCWQRNNYDHRNSSTYKSDGLEVSVEYNEGFCSGYTSFDTVTIGTGHIKDQHFVEVVDQFGSDSLSPKIDGILGLGFLKPNSGRTNLLQYMVEQGLIKHIVYCIYLNRNASAAVKAVLTFGGCLDIHHTEEFSFAPVASTKEWLVNITLIECTAGNSTLTLYGDYMLALVHSGTTEVLLSIDIYSHIFSWLLTVGAVPEAVVNCSDISNLPSLTFTIADKKYTLEGEDYILPFDKSERRNNKCFPGINEINDDWGVLGEVFMRRYYTMFDGENMLIGFAPAV